MLETYDIPEANMGTLTARIAVLNKRAAKLGCSPITLTKVGEIVEQEFSNIEHASVWRQEGEAPPPYFKPTGVMRRFFSILVKGEAPKFNGWTLAATIQKTEAGNILRCVPGMDTLNPRYRDCTPACDHCKADRNRRDTFVVVHEDGTQKQVGRQCIRDFLGHTNPETLARLAELGFSVKEICDEESEFYGGGSEKKVFGLIPFLAHVVAVTEGKAFITGKMSKEEPYPQPTSVTAHWNMCPTAEMRKRGEVVEVTEAHRTLAQTAVEYVLDTIPAKSSLSDFDHNLLVAAKSEVIEQRTFGIAAYIIPFYRRETEKQVERTKQFVAGHFGEVKKRYKAAKLTYLGTSSFPSPFGYEQMTHINRFRTPEGKVAVWKTSTDNMEWAEQGAELTVDYTVKEHGEYKGTLQTYITRLKFVGETPTSQTVD